ncbi:type I restriction-modification enzyme R subunit C-terminal domain-containing protein [Thiomicrospira sp. WB1]|uniref:type I restriction endonuclease subunit R n=1 Tax=Thiomicrospira sp. WB1 TaxID=1685380 RepID=UPI000747B006|nr:type I restriction-modification enzyme R subunit C-terminal domain-containing protein [Thiomicrospira sp. WB1]KUJ72507.1 restriction endonuclease subunit R [Thiomicrospira sp. WB1]
MDEASTRQCIDQKLTLAGWVVQDKNRLNLHESLGVAVREMDTDTGPADYMLFVAGKACGIIEAKREGTALGGVAEQSGRYAASSTAHIKRWANPGEPLPFLYEATNQEVFFRDERDPKPRSRRVFHFHRPETLHDWVQQSDTFRYRLQNLPDLDIEGLRDCQVDAITGIEASLKHNKPRALLQMATGAGKTFTAVTQVYRLAKFAQAKSILFLVDRGNLGRQALKEFQNYTVPGDGRKFTSLYNVTQLGGAGIGDDIKVTISTIQRLYSQLSGKELDDETEEHSTYEIEASGDQKPKEVRYNPDIPIEQFDLIIIDECHRSIYNLWRQVLDYFDAFLIGLTATPTKKTIGFFGQNLVSEYTHEDAIVDEVNVGYDIYRIKTQLSEEGNTLEAGTTVSVRDKLTKAQRLQKLDEDETYLASQIDRSVIAPNQIKTIIKGFKDRCLPECFPERHWVGEEADRRMEWVPKTLIFAKDDDHADRIVTAVREVFNEGNDFCKKVTYRVGKKTADETIADFRTNPRFRVAVTVDMIATGTDIKPLECVLFMRDVKSQAYYEQMKGRGTRVIDVDDLRKVTPDAVAKTRFVLVDAVGVTETDKTESKSLERKPSISTKNLMEQIARGDRHSDSLRSLGNRLMRLDMKLSDAQRAQVTKVAEQPLALIAGKLIHATNDESLVENACQTTGKIEDDLTDDDIQHVFEPQADALVKPFHNPDLRELLEDLRRDTEQIVDDTADELIDGTGYDVEKAEHLIESWQQFIQDHQNELDAITLIYQKPYQQRHLSYDLIEQLADEIKQPPYNIAPLEVWKAYEQLEKAKVKCVPAKDLLTHLVSLIRFATQNVNQLEPFDQTVNKNYQAWLKQTRETGAQFSDEQTQWLEQIKDQIAQNAEMTLEDFEYTPFNENGGLIKARQLFGQDLNKVIQELNGYLIA